MARIELRNTTVRVVDGYSGTSAVNLSAGYSSSDTVMEIDTTVPSGNILEQTRFTVVGSSLTHQITIDNASHRAVIDVGAASGGTFTITFEGQETGNIAYNATAATVLAALVALSNVTALLDFTVTGAGVQTTDPWIIQVITTSPDHGQIARTSSGDGTNLTASDTLTYVNTVTTGGGGGALGGATHIITFTPALDGSVSNNAVITLTGRALEFNIGDGNVTWSEKKEFNYDLNKGNLDAVRQGNEIPVDMTLSAVYEFLKAPAGDLTPTFEEALKQTGRASSWLSSSSDLCEPYAVDIEIDHIPTCSGVDKETTIIPDFRFESLDHDPKEATISATGRANATQATVTRG